MSVLESRDYALLAANAAADKKATDVVALEVGPMLVITDYFVIATGSNDRQVAAIAEEVEDQLRDAGLRCIGREGVREGKWILLDFADVVVHVFQSDERDFYRLEKLWSDAERLPLPAEVANVSASADAVDTAESDEA